MGDLESTLIDKSGGQNFTRFNFVLLDSHTKVKKIVHVKNVANPISKTQENGFVYLKNRQTKTRL